MRFLNQCPATAPRNGLANVKNSAKPMPIIATASRRPATRNICTRSTGSSSGWRAEPSMKRPPRMPKPMAVPRAPMPKMMPTASTVMAWMCAMLSIQLSYNKINNPLPQPAAAARVCSMVLARHRQIDDRQHHEYEGLQRNHKQVEQGPHERQQVLHDQEKPAAEMRQRRDALQRQHREQQEHHLTGIEVA